MEQIVNLLLSIYIYDPMATSLMSLIAVYCWVRNIYIIDNLLPSLSQKFGITKNSFIQNLLFLLLGVPILRGLSFLIGYFFDITGSVFQILRLLLSSLWSVYSLSPIYTITAILIYIVLSFILFYYYVSHKLRSKKVTYIFIMTVIFLIINLITEPIVKKIIL